MKREQIDFVSSLVMPYAKIGALDWRQVAIFIGDECQVRGYKLSDNAMRAFKKEFNKRKELAK